MKEFWDQILRYLYLKKRDPNIKKTTWLKTMNFMTRLAIITLLIALIYYFYKHWG